MPRPSAAALHRARADEVRARTRARPPQARRKGERVFLQATPAPPRTDEMPTTAFRLTAIAMALVLGGCAETYIGTGYATVPLQLVVTRGGKFEILDRPELGRVAISPTP